MNLITWILNNKVKINLSLIINIITSIVLALITNFFLQYFQMSGNLPTTINWIKQHLFSFLLSSIFIYFVYVFVLSLLGNLYISTFICLGIFMGIGFSNKNKLATLGEPLYPVDFYQIRYIKTLFKMVGGTVSLLSLFIFVLIIAMFIFAFLKLPKLKLSILIRTLLLSISIFMIYAYTNFNSNFLEKPVAKSGVSIVLWNQPYNYDTNGFVFGLLSNLQTLVMEEPEGYNEVAIKQIVDKYKSKSDSDNLARTNKADDIKPNIILLMSETFWDPTRLTSVTFSEDPMKNMREIMLKHSSGLLLSPEFGGNTANVEFEALTGFSMYNLISGSIPYQQSMDKSDLFPSLVDMLNKRDYSTIALHPYNKAFYKRNRIYNTLGFSEFIGENEIKDKTALSEGSYISDQAVVNEVLDKINEQEKPLFIHTVTMQNHLPLNDGKYGTNSISINGSINETNKKELETYAEGIKQTDIAIKNLTDNLDKIKEPTVVIFFGDHLPSLTNSIYQEAGYATGSASEGQRAMSETPMFIYSNYDLEKQDLKTLSPAFLSATLIDLLDIPVTPYYEMLNSIQSLLPGLKTNLLIGADTNIKGQLNKEEELLLNEYKLIQYDVMLGKQYSLLEFFK